LIGSLRLARNFPSVTAGIFRNNELRCEGLNVGNLQSEEVLLIASIKISSIEI